MTQLDLSGISFGEAGQHLVTAIRSWGNKPLLEELNVNGCKIPNTNKICYALRCCKSLTELDLGGNDLCGTLSRLLPDGHSGLPELQYFILSGSNLGKEDLQSLKQSVEKDKLPHLKVLNLENNDLSKMEPELEDLLEALVSQYQRKVKVHLKQNGLSEDFNQKWRSKCDLADVVLDLGDNTARSSTEVFRSQLQQIVSLLLNRAEESHEGKKLTITFVK